MRYEFFGCLLVFILFPLLFKESLCISKCHNSFECSLINITNSNNNSSIQCYGFGSCAESLKIINFGYNTECYGSFSCYKSKLIHFRGTKPFSTKCMYILQYLLYYLLLIINFKFIAIDYN